MLKNESLPSLIADNFMIILFWHLLVLFLCKALKNDFFITIGICTKKNTGRITGASIANGLKSSVGKIRCRNISQGAVFRKKVWTAYR